VPPLTRQHSDFEEWLPTLGITGRAVLGSSGQRSIVHCERKKGGAQPPHIRKR